MKIKAKKLYPDAQLPQMMRQGDAALDLYAQEEHTLKPGERTIVGTGVAMAIPMGYWGNIRDRGGLPLKHGIHTMGGVVDSNYRGEIKVIMINLSDEEYTIKKGDRICQMIVHQHEVIDFEEVDELDNTNRGEDGFASSGY